MRALFGLVLLAVFATAHARPPITMPPDARAKPERPVLDDGLLISTSSLQQLLNRESAGPDTFDLYGGPSNRLRDPDGIPDTGDEYIEGKFEDPTGTFPRGLSDSPNDWTGYDATERPLYWSVDTFNAANLNGHGAGNHAAWIGLPAGIDETAEWTDAPGYGNNWNNALEYTSAPVADPSVGQTVDLDFVLNIDSELGYDFLYVAYESEGSWIDVLVLDGTNKDVGGVFPAPGLRYSDLGADAIVYAGDDYGTGDRIRLRLLFASDGAYSDEDGLFEGDGGAQVDDIVVTTSQGTFTEDFEGAGPFLWNERKQPFAGDFANVFLRATDIDPCAGNSSPQLNFIDRGQAPPNGPGASGATSTGGSISPTWSYGVPGGYVFNYTGGLDDTIDGVQGEARSPEIPWDLPGASDDGADVLGAYLAFDIMRHQPLANGVFYNWGVRSRVDGEWNNFKKRGSSYYSAGAEYLRHHFDVTDLVQPGADRVQFHLRAFDWSSIFGFPGTDATPGPWFDNVRFTKYRIGGPTLSTRTIDTANDGFPVSGAIDVSTQAARDLLDVRFDMARDISSGDAIVSGDSVIVDCAAIIPGTTLTDLRMVWALRQNPLFESAIRALPNRSKDENVATSTLPDGRPLWTGEVVADTARTAFAGVPVADRYFVDLPDEDFLYPGDVLHYYLQATDSDGRVTTLPADTSGFAQWDDEGRSVYDRTWTVRALPILRDASGDQPSILVWNDFGRRGGEEEFLSAFGQLGLAEGRDFDTYTTQGPTSGVSNGLGAAGEDNGLGDRRGHGATVQQIAGYSTIVYLSGDLSTRLMSDGTDEDENDKGDDLALLTAWKNEPGDRGSIYFGDNLCTGLTADSPVAGAAYVAQVMGVQALGPNVENLVGGQTSILFRDVGLGLSTDPFIALGGCPTENTFDHIMPGPGAINSHEFDSPLARSPLGVSAGVLFARDVDGFTKADLTFPFGISSVIDPVSRALPGVSARTRLLEDALTAVGASFLPGMAVDAPTRREPSLAVQPNPFNPRTTVVFTVPMVGTDARVEVFDLRGQRVATLFDGVADSGQLRLTWDGRDARGARVASGVYLVRARAEGFVGAKKVALVE